MYILHFWVWDNFVLLYLFLNLVLDTPLLLGITLMLWGIALKIVQAGQKLCLFYS